MINVALIVIHYLTNQDNQVTQDKHYQDTVADNKHILYKILYPR